MYRLDIHNCGESMTSSAESQEIISQWYIRNKREWTGREVRLYTLRGHNPVWLFILQDPPSSQITQLTGDQVSKLIVLRWQFSLDCNNHGFSKLGLSGLIFFFWPVVFVYLRWIDIYSCLSRKSHSQSPWDHLNCTIFRNLLKIEFSSILYTIF